MKIKHLLIAGLAAGMIFTGCGNSSTASSAASETESTVSSAAEIAESEESTAESEEETVIEQEDLDEVSEAEGDPTIYVSEYAGIKYVEVTNDQNVTGVTYLGCYYENYTDSDITIVPVLAEINGEEVEATSDETITVYAGKRYRTNVDLITDIEAKDIETLSVSYQILDADGNTLEETSLITIK